MAKINIDAAYLTEQQAVTAFDQILIGLLKCNGEQKEELLFILTNQFEDLDTEDFFGTKGWRHLFGFEDCW